MVKKSWKNMYYNSLRNLGVYSFLEGLSNIIYWFKIIWNDRQWDYYYFLVIIRAKLNRMIKYREHSPNFMEYEGHNIDLERMKTTYKAVDRLVKDNYLIEYDKYEKAVEERKNDYKILFESLREHLPGWWD